MSERSVSASVEAWRALALPQDLRGAVERAAAADGVDPVSWLAKAVMRAAGPDGPSDGASQSAARDAEIARSLTRLLTAVRAQDGEPAVEAIVETPAKSGASEPPALIRLTAERGHSEDKTETETGLRRQRRHGAPWLVLGISLAAAVLGGAALFYLGLGTGPAARDAAVSVPLPQQQPDTSSAASPPSTPPPASMPAAAPPATATVAPAPAPSPTTAATAAPSTAISQPPQVAAETSAATASATPPVAPAATTSPGESPTAPAAPTGESTEATASPDMSMPDATTAFGLGVRYAFGEGVPQDYQKAAEQFRIAAQQGLPDAEYNLGALYDSGLGVPHDPVRAVIWYHSAAEQGHPSAQLNLGLAYANGSGVAQDYGEAARWFRRAADQGVITAQYNLAALYANGKGVPQSMADAYAWFSIAAGAGDAEAQRQMQRIAASFSPKQLHDARALAASLSQEISHTADPQLHGTVSAPESAGAPKPQPSAAEAPASAASPTAPVERAIVAEIQRSLMRLHYDPGRVDGVVSDKTTDAIRKYQSDRNLKVDGEATRALMFRLKAEVQQQAKQ
ncbi:MAG TPA: SEL1-like repeat protein [Stellaceae bacterium]|nr:SEL1-like repeat protein [Stellaceae bacterium]